MDDRSLLLVLQKRRRPHAFYLDASFVPIYRRRGVSLARQEFMPTSEEEKMLLNFNGNKDLLGNAEKVRFFEIRSRYLGVLRSHT